MSAVSPGDVCLGLGVQLVVPQQAWGLSAMTRVDDRLISVGREKLTNGVSHS